METSKSPRETEAQARAERRLRRQRDLLRPLGLVMIASVAISAINGHPAPRLHGQGLGVLAALTVFAASLGFAIRATFVEQSVAVQTTVIAAMGAAGVALAVLQPRGATELAGGAAVWMAVARLPLLVSAPLAVAVTGGLVLAETLGGGSVAAGVAAALLCALLAFVAYFIRQARASQDTTELLLAQLEDAREEQLRAAAISERGRIASELHDVLAHSLSGAAIQLQGARKLAERQQASPQLHDAIERAGELVRDGLANARQAVGALRGDALPTLAQLESLVAAFKSDIDSNVSLAIEGDTRPLPTDASLALYRGAQEALTNIARYAPGACTTVTLHYSTGHTSLTIEDQLEEARPNAGGLTDVGSGNGLAGLRERIERAGGSMTAGPTENGWRVELKMPG